MATQNHTLIENEAHQGIAPTAIEHERQAKQFLPLIAGAKVGRSQLQEQMRAVSGEADLWLGNWEPNGRKVVVKVYRVGVEPKPEVLEKIRELPQEHVIEVIEHGRIALPDGRYFEALEFIEQGSLADRRRIGPEDPERVRLLVSKLTNAVHLLHANNILHRDLKPGNVLVRNWESMDVVLTDFGIASLTHADLHLTTRNRTAAYSAPEALSGVLSKASDWWSIGVITLELLLGKHPFAQLDERVINRTLSTRGIEVPGALPREWEMLIKGLLTCDPEKRWNHAQIKAWLSGKRNIPVHYGESGAEKHPYKFCGGEYRSIEELGRVVAGADGQRWKEISEQIAQGLISDWIQREFQEMDLVSKLNRIRNDKELSPEIMVGLTAMALNAEVPMTLKGYCLTVQSLGGFGAEAGRLLDGKLPEWLEILRGDCSLKEIRARKDRVLRFVSATKIPFNSTLAEKLAISDIQQVAHVVVDRARMNLHSEHPEIDKLLKKHILKREEAVLLATCEQTLFTLATDSNNLVKDSDIDWLLPPSLGAIVLPDLPRQAEFTAGFPIECDVEISGITQDIENTPSGRYSPGLHTIKLPIFQLPPDSVSRGKIRVTYAGRAFEHNFYAVSAPDQTFQVETTTRAHSPQEIAHWRNSIASQWASRCDECIVALKDISLHAMKRPISLQCIEDAKQNAQCHLEDIENTWRRYNRCAPSLSYPQALKEAEIALKATLTEGSEQIKHATIKLTELRVLVERGFVMMALDAAKNTPEIRLLPDEDSAFLKKASIQLARRRWALIFASIALGAVVLTALAIFVRNIINPQ